MKRISIIGLLVIVFAAPGIAAYVMYHHPEWFRTKMTNRGQLLTPALLLEKESLSPKWHLLYWGVDGCDKLCEKRMDDLARVRLALGRRLYQVEFSLALQTDAPLSNRVREQIRKIDGQILEISAANSSLLGAKPGIYIINPEHYVILKYDIDQPNDDMFQDIKKMVSDK